MNNVHIVNSGNRQVLTLFLFVSSTGDSIPRCEEPSFSVCDTSTVEKLIEMDSIIRFD